MDGIVVWFEQTEEYCCGRIRGSDGAIYQVSGKTIELDCIGRCFLVPSEPVVFDGGKSVSRNGKSHRCAINIKRPWGEKSIDPAQQREICKVLDKNWLIRQIGGRLTIDMNEPEYDFLQDRQIVECGVRPPRKGSTWRAVDIKILARSEENLDWSKVEAGNA